MTSSFLPDESGAFGDDVQFPESDHALVYAESNLKIPIIPSTCNRVIRRFHKESIAPAYNYFLSLVITKIDVPFPSGSKYF